VIDRDLRARLEDLLGAERVLDGGEPYDHDATELRGIRAEPDAVVLPETAGEVADVVAACCAARAAIVPRGGGTGFAGGAVAVGGGVVVSLERLRRVRSLEPGLWRMEVEAGITTRDVQRLALENGLLFPPDPGGAEQSQIGGNVATNAGGPHALKYGTTGAWVTGVEAVIAPGELVRFGGPVRKDVAGYDLKRVMIGSEGTLGIVTAVWLRLIPRPEANAPVLASYPSAEAGGRAILAVLSSGVVPAALEYLDAATMRAVGGEHGDGFTVIAESDGSAAEVERERAELREALAAGATRVEQPDPGALWRWRESVSLGVAAQRGGKLSEDVVVPVEHVAAAADEIVAIGERHGLEACSWGHAGDGNLHATFLVDRTDAGEIERAERAAADVFAMAERLGGSISGEHGIGIAKRDHVRRPPRERELMLAVKRAFDPDNLMNPGKKLVV